MNKFIISFIPSAIIGAGIWMFDASHAIYFACFLYVYQILIYQTNEKLLELRMDLESEIEALKEQLQNK